MKLICCNSDCRWIGKEEDCVYFKHDYPPTKLFCPECNEVVEEIIEQDNAEIEILED